MLLAGAVCSVVGLCFNRLWLSYLAWFCLQYVYKRETSTVGVFIIMFVLSACNISLVESQCNFTNVVLSVCVLYFCCS